MARSRLQKHIKNTSVRNGLLSIGGIILIMVLLFTVGSQLLIQFSIILTKDSPGKIVSEKTQLAASYIAPPQLNALPEATKKETIEITGYATTGEKIVIYLNNEKAKESFIEKDHSFTISDIRLSPGKNNVKAKVITEDKKTSDYSKELTILYLNKPPELILESPQDGQTFSKDHRKIYVSGKTDPDVSIRVNSSVVIQKSDGSFSKTIQLNEGDNTLKVEVTDKAGNTATKEIKVKVE